MPHITSALDDMPEFKANPSLRQALERQAFASGSRTEIGDANVAMWQQGQAPGFAFSGQPGYKRIVEQHLQDMSTRQQPQMPSQQEMAANKQRADEQLARSKQLRQLDLSRQGTRVDQPRQQQGPTPQQQQRQEHQQDVKRQIRERIIERAKTPERRKKLTEAYQRDYGQAPATKQQEAREQRLAQFEAENRARMPEPRQGRQASFTPVPPLDYLQPQRQELQPQLEQAQAEAERWQKVFEAVGTDFPDEEKLKSLGVKPGEISTDEARKQMQAAKSRAKELETEVEAIERRQKQAQAIVKSLPDDLTMLANPTGAKTQPPPQVTAMLQREAFRRFPAERVPEVVELWSRSLGYMPPDDGLSRQNPDLSQTVPVEQPQLASQGSDNGQNLPVAPDADSADAMWDAGKPFVFQGKVYDPNG